jgi:hypothetical protein
VPTEDGQRGVRVDAVDAHDDAAGLVDRLLAPAGGGDGLVRDRPDVPGDRLGHVDDEAPHADHPALRVHPPVTGDHHAADLAVHGDDAVVGAEGVAVGQALLDDPAGVLPVLGMLVVEQELGGRDRLARIEAVYREDLVRPPPGVLGHPVQIHARRLTDGLGRERRALSHQTLLKRPSTKAPPLTRTTYLARPP